jgi:mono/diheme cytochrome c family protein
MIPPRRRVATLPILCLTLGILVTEDSARGRSHAQSQTPGGVVATYQAGNAAPDTTALPGLALFVAQGLAPTPFLPPGPFTAEIDGQLTVDLRDDYHFRAELSGSARLTVGEVVVLTATGSRTPATTTKPIRLNRGMNRIKVTYTSPPSADAYLRLYWSSPAIDWEPIPARVLSRPPGPATALDRGQQRRVGRMLVLEYRCTKCHKAAADGVEPAHLDAPSFEGIGLRRNPGWMARWIADPRALRRTARMPKLLHDSEAAGAGDIAAYLATLRGSPPAAAATDGDASAGEELFNTLHCSSCHDGSGDGAGLRQKLPLEGVRDKFAPGALADFLRKPNRHFASIAMPDFHLTDDEVDALAAWLESKASSPPADAPAGNATRGETLVQERGCLTCHASGLAGKYAGGPAFGDLAAASWSKAWHDSSSRSAVYQLTADERQAIQGFGGTDWRALVRETPAEFASAQLDRLNCAGCHDAIERIPRLDAVGGKLRPEWTRKLLEGSLSYKPRPWVEARMPAFGGYAERLAPGLAAQHGYPPASPNEPAPADTSAADIGRQMVVSGGCANCHNVGEFVGGQSPSTAGINFIYTAERLMDPYFHRWMLNPPRIWPETVMPRYFSGGKGPFPFYDGNIDQQIRALWEYMRLGANMPAPQ